MIPMRKGKGTVKTSRVAIEQLQFIKMKSRVAKDICGFNRVLDLSRIPQGTYPLRVVRAELCGCVESCEEVIN